MQELTDIYFTMDHEMFFNMFTPKAAPIEE